jgi:hypothetical protein
MSDSGPPPRRRPAAGVVRRVPLPVEVVVVDVFLAAVDFDHRRDERDDVVADVLNERRLFDDEAVRELHEHLGPPDSGECMPLVSQ